jgi:hypothetical protein
VALSVREEVNCVNWQDSAIDKFSGRDIRRDQRIRSMDREIRKCLFSLPTDVLSVVVAHLADDKDKRSLRLTCKVARGLIDTLGRPLAGPEKFYIPRMFICADIVDLPASLGNLHQLQQLALYSMQDLQRLPEEISRLTALTQLSISYCKELDLQSIACLTNLRNRTKRQMPVSVGAIETARVAVHFRGSR